MCSDQPAGKGDTGDGVGEDVAITGVTGVDGKETGCGIWTGLGVFDTAATELFELLL